MGHGTGCLLLGIRHFVMVVHAGELGEHIVMEDGFHILTESGDRIEEEGNE
jgi:hypothetical protein